MLSIAARSKGAQTWVRQATIVFGFAVHGRGLSICGDGNALTL